MKRKTIIVLFLLIFSFPFWGNTTISNAETAREQVKREFSEKSMPGGFSVMGTGFVHYDSADTPDRLFPLTIGSSHPRVYSAKGLCGGKYDDYTYTGTPQYVRSLLLKLGMDGNTVIREDYFIKDGEFLLMNQGQYSVVDFDEKAQKYIVWCKGDWNGEMEAISCTSVGYNLSYRPGFYAIDKRYLYVDDVFHDQAVPASIGTGNIMKPYLLLYKEASTSSDVYWWANQIVNKQVVIVGEEGAFYKISFQNSQFLKKRRLCYVQKKYVNAELNGAARPQPVYQAQVSTTVNIRSDSSFQSEILGVAYKGTKIDVIARGNEFDTIVFNGKTAYIACKYMDNYVLNDSYKCNIKMSGGIKIRKITKKSITFGWKKTADENAYRIIYTNGVKREETAVQGNSISIPLSVVNKNVRIFRIWAYPAKKLPDGKYSVSQSFISRAILVPPAGSYRVKRRGRTMTFTFYLSKVGTQMQYSIHKNFKSSKSV